MTPPLPSIPKPAPGQPGWQWPALFKNELFVVLLVCGILVVVGIVTISYFQKQRKTISAGNIVVTPVGPGYAQIRGSFTISSSTVTISSILAQKNLAIPSQGTGGACLAAEWKAFLPDVLPDLPDSTGYYCAKNQDCTAKLPSHKQRQWSGYCDQAGNGGKGECWLKPGDKEFCNRSKDYGPPPRIWADGTYDTPKDGPYFVPDFPSQTSVEHSADYVVYPGPISWRVVACLNQIDPKTKADSQGCGDPKQEDLKIQVFGPAEKLNYGLALKK